MRANAGRIQSTTHDLLKKQSLDLNKLEPTAFRKVLADVATALPDVSKTDVYLEIMDMWTRANDRGAGKEKVTGGDQYQNATSFRSMTDSPLGARMAAMTQPKKIDLNTLVSKAEFDAASAVLQASQADFAGMGMPEMKQAVADLKTVVEKTAKAATRNRFLEVPAGAEYHGFERIPEELSSKITPSKAHLSSNTVEGRANDLVERFQKTGVPQAATVNGELLIVDDKRPDAGTAVGDFERRLGTGNLNRDTRSLLFDAQSRLDLLEQQAENPQ